MQCWPNLKIFGSYCHRLCCIRQCSVQRDANMMTETTGEVTYQSSYQHRSGFVVLSQNNFIAAYVCVRQLSKNWNFILDSTGKLDDFTRMRRKILLKMYLPNSDALSKGFSRMFNKHCLQMVLGTKNTFNLLQAAGISAVY